MKLPPLFLCLISLPMAGVAKQSQPTIEETIQALERSVWTVRKESKAEEAKLRSSYLAALRGLETRIAKAGDLDGVIKIRDEIKAIESGEALLSLNTLEKPVPDDLRRMRSTFETELGKIQANEKSRLREQAGKTVAEFAALETRLTRSNRIDAAVKVRESKLAFEEAHAALLKMAPEPAPLKNLPKGAIMVSPDGAGETVSLAEAIDEAVPGRVLALHPGQYGKVTIEKDEITLIGNHSVFSDLRILSNEVGLNGIGAGGLYLGGWIEGTDEPLIVKDVRIENCRFNRLQAGHNTVSSIENSVGSVSINFGARVRLRQCTILPNSSAEHPGINIAQGTDVEISNCILVGRDYTILSIRGGPERCEIKNSLLFHEKEFLAINQEGPKPDYRPETRRTAELEYGFKITGGLFEKPQFVDPDNGDYRLTESSPGKGKAGNDRDLGAHLDNEGWPIPFD